MSYDRSQRVADQLKRELATLIQREIRDPRIGMVNITEVEVSRDLCYAKVYVTIVGQETAEKIKESVAVLNQAAGFLRSQVARTSHARTTPKLQFYFDSSVGQGRHLSALIDKALAEDNEITKL